jgi:hypothetical protein
VDRLLDHDHSALSARFADGLTAAGWVVRAEVSFNHYGERGRIDLLAVHPPSGATLVIEVKTALVDAQAVLGTLDVKARVAPVGARELGWRPSQVVLAIFFLDGTTVRRHIRRLASLFARYRLRGHAARRWLRAPAEPVDGLLILAKLPNRNGVDRRRAGRRRIRVRSSAAGGTGA